MSVRIVHLGSARQAGEGLRIGTVRRPPRGVPKADYAKRNFYDVWLPALAPSAPLVRTARAARSDSEWQQFSHKYRAEMRRPAAARVLDLLAALSGGTNFSVGCYCQDESRCHRSILRSLLADRGATII
jgi:uncharacterized protein YeaO (DUF488 family)